MSNIASLKAEFNAAKAEHNALAAQKRNGTGGNNIVKKFNESHKKQMNAYDAWYKARQAAKAATGAAAGGRSRKSRKQSKTRKN